MMTAAHYSESTRVSAQLYNAGAPVLLMTTVKGLHTILEHFAVS